MAQDKRNSDMGQTAGPERQKLDPWLRQRLLRADMAPARPLLSAYIISRASPMSSRPPLGERSDRLTQQVVNRSGLVTRTPETMALSAPENVGNTSRYLPSSGWSELELLVSSRDTDRGTTGRPAVSSAHGNKERSMDIKNIRTSPSPEAVRVQPAANTLPRAAVISPPSGQARIVRRKIEETPSPSPNRPIAVVKVTDEKPISRPTDVVTSTPGTVPVEKSGQRPVTRKMVDSTGAKVSPDEDSRQSPVKTVSTSPPDMPVRRISRKSISVARKSQQASPVKSRSNKSTGKEDIPGRNRTSEHIKTEGSKHVKEVETRPSIIIQPEAAPVIENEYKNRPYSSSQPAITPVTRTDNQSKPVADRRVGEIRPAVSKVISRKLLSSVESRPVVTKGRENTPKEPVKLDIPASTVARKPISTARPTTPKVSGVSFNTGVSKSPKPASYSVSPEQTDDETKTVNPVTGVHSSMQDVPLIHTSRPSLSKVVTQPTGLQAQSISTSEQPPELPNAHLVEEEKLSLQPPVVRTDLKGEASDISTPPLQDTPDHFPTTASLADASHETSLEENVSRAVMSPSRKPKTTVQRSVTPEVKPIKPYPAEKKPHDTSENTPVLTDRPKVDNHAVPDSVPPVSIHRQAEKDSSRALPEYPTKPALETTPVSELVSRPVSQPGSVSVSRSVSRSTSESVSVPTPEQVSEIASGPVSGRISIPEPRPVSGLGSGSTSGASFRPISLPVQRLVKPATSVIGTHHEDNTPHIPGAGIPAALDLPVARIARPNSSEEIIHNEGLFRKASGNSQPPPTPSQTPVEVHSLPGFSSTSTYVNRAEEDTSSAATTSSTTTDASENNQQQNDRSATPDLKALARDIYPIIRRMLIVEKERLPIN